VCAGGSPSSEARQEGAAPHRDRLAEPLSQRVRRLLPLVKVGDDLLVSGHRDPAPVLAERPSTR
jgi:hypothetical protein